MPYGLPIRVNFVLTGAIPAAPSNLAGSAISNTRIDGTYTPGTGSNVTHTLAYSGNGGATWTEQTVTGGTYSITGLTGNQLYLIRLKASNIWGPTAWVGPIAVFTLGNPPTYPALIFSDDRNSMYAGVI